MLTQISEHHTTLQEIPTGLRALGMTLGVMRHISDWIFRYPYAIMQKAFFT